MINIGNGLWVYSPAIVKILVISIVVILTSIDPILEKCEKIEDNFPNPFHQVNSRADTFSENAL